MSRYNKRPLTKREDDYKRFKPEKKKVILPIFEPSGLLELESNNKEGILLKHIKPLDAQSPDSYWDKYNIPARRRIVFKAILYKRGQSTPIKEYNMDEKDHYLIGRGLGRSLGNNVDLGSEDEQEKEIILADIPVPEETCSKQHCVIQFRNISDTLKAYVMDLDSSNGTVLNSVVLPRARYVELRAGDVIMLSEVEEDTDYEIAFMSV